MHIIPKTPKQIEGIRKACKLVANTLKYLQPSVVKGITTLELNDLADKYITDNGGRSAALNYCGYPKSICISLNETICHGIPDSTKLKDGDILNVDVALELDGYYGDTGTMFSIGKISEDAKYLLETAKECMDVGIKQCKPNNHYGNIGYAMTRFAQCKGVTIVADFTSHGVGTSLHEPPQILNYETKVNVGPRMQQNHVFTCEPMISLGSPKSKILKDGWTAVTEDGSLSAQYEHTILVTKNGCEILT